MEEPLELVEQGLLYDYYGPMLTRHQQKIYEEAVYENLSLNEIAEIEGVSKQAVHDLLRRTTTILENYEKSLGMIKRTRKIMEETSDLRKKAEKSTSLKELQDYALNMADRIDRELK